MNKLGISIIIPCYRSGQMLLQAVTSIMLQTISYNYEIVIVDDGSSDRKTIESLNQLKNSSYIIIIELFKNQGAQNARNVGIRNSSYQFILMMDADDLLNTDKKTLINGSYIDRSIYILENYPDSAFVYSATLMFGDKNELRNNFALTEKLIMQKHRISIGLIYRKIDVACNRPYAETIKKWQDWSFAVGIMNRRKKLRKKNNIILLKEPYYLYRIHNTPSRISMQKICERDMLKNTMNLYPEIFKDHFPNKSQDETVNFLLISSQNIRQFKPYACIDCNNMSNQCIRKRTSV